MWTVIYRTGGELDCTWKKCRPVATMQEAVSEKGSLLRAGYKAIIHSTSQLGTIGLPEGWSYGR